MRIEQPVFVVTGRKEDVAEAKKEIISAADHFSQIRASRRNNNGENSGGLSTVNNSSGSSSVGPPTNCPGHITVSLPVPLKEVGLVVGPKGATIKRIQQHTQTYIVTPGRDKKPIFEVTGLPENVEKACEEIRSYLDRRTGRSRDATINNSLNALSGSMSSLANINTGLSNSINSLNNSMNSLNTLTPGLGLNERDHTGDFHSNGFSMESSFQDAHADLLGSIFKPPSSNSAFTSYKHMAYSTAADALFMQQSSMSQPNKLTDFSAFQGPQPLHCRTALGAAPPVSTVSSLHGLYDSDEGIGSPTYDSNSLQPHHTSISNIWGEFDASSLSLFAPALPSSTLRRQQQHSPPAAPCSDLLGLTTPACMMGGSAMLKATSVACRNEILPGGSNSSSSSPTDSTGSAGCCSASASATSRSSPSATTRRTCVVCKEGDVAAALVPCDHNLMCMECAQTIVHKPENQRHCPGDGCVLPPQTAIQIFS